MSWYSEAESQRLSKERELWIEKVRNRLLKNTDRELVDAANREVGVKAWVSARGAYLHCLREEMGRRGFDYAAVNGLQAFPGWRRFRLIGKKLEFEDEAE